MLLINSFQLRIGPDQPVQSSKDSLTRSYLLASAAHCIQQIELALCKAPRPVAAAWGLRSGGLFRVCEQESTRQEPPLGQHPSLPDPPLTELGVVAAGALRVRDGAAATATCRCSTGSPRSPPA